MILKPRKIKSDTVSAVSPSISPEVVGLDAGGSVVKKPLAMQEIQETWVQSLGWEDPLEKGMAPHSSILAWRILWAKEPCGLQSIRSQRVRHD